MSVCSNCGTKLEEGQKFCSECGTPVPQIKKCIRCGKELPVNAKFCPECGTKQDGGITPSTGGISMGDKNIVSGDIIGRKDEYKVSGNATIVHNEDESGKVEKCHICGSIVKRIEGYECSSCGNFTCADCFDTGHRVCAGCFTASKKTYVGQYMDRLKDFISNDGRIDFIERQELLRLQQQYGISRDEAEKMEREVKQEYLGAAIDEFTTVEKVSLEKIPDLFFDKGKADEAYRLIEPIYQNHKADENVLSLYVQILEEVDPDKVRELKQKLTYDDLQTELALARIAIQERNLDEAERILNAAERMWKDSSLVKCHKVLYTLALHEHFGTEEWLDKAEKMIPELGDANSKLELSWQVKVQIMINDAHNNEPFDIDEGFCMQNQLYYSFMNKDLLNGNVEKELPNDLIFIKGGKLTLGSEEECDNPFHEVKLKSFYISKYEVTQGLYESVTGNNPSYFKGSKKPVECVSWYDAVEFCNSLSMKEGLKPAYTINKTKKDPNNKDEWDDIKWTVTCDFTANGYRLPTEAEWEYAARGGQKSKGYEFAGSDNIDEIAWYKYNSSGKTHPVGEKKANELGLYDMSGNIWEWCWDWYSRSLNSGPQTNPTGASSGSYRVTRGGGWNYDASNCAVSYRGNSNPYDRNYCWGFRLARSSSK